MKNIKKLIDSHLEIIYIILLNLYIFALILDTNFVYAIYMNSLIIKILKLPILIVSIYKIIFNDFKDYNWKSVIVSSVIVLLLIVSMIISRGSGLLQLFIIILGSYKLNFNKILKYTLITESTVFGIIILLSLIGILPNWKYERGLEITRHSLGFQYSSYLSLFSFSFTVYYLYLRKEKLRWFEYIILGTINIIFFAITNTRFPLILSELTIILFLCINIFKRKNMNIKTKNIKYFLYFVTIGCILISIIFPIMYNNNNPFTNKLDQIFSDRLSLGNKGIRDYGINLFGNKIDIIGLAAVHEGVASTKDFFVIDSTYLSILLENGIVVLSCIIYLLLKLNKKAIEDRDYYLLLIIMIFEIFSITDSIGCRLQFNIFILLFSTVIIKDSKEDSVVEKKVDIMEVHREQSKMLEKLTKYLDENKLRYFLCGGTLLGAIRHKGFIPWDDDIDLLMPRPDFERLKELTSKNNSIDNNIYILHPLKDKNNFPFIKVINNKYIILEENLEDNNKSFLWVDIFPMDGLSENEQINAKLYKKVKKYRNLLKLKLLDDDYVIKTSSKGIKMYLKPFLKLFVDIIPLSYICNKINKISKTYSYDNSKYVGGLMWGYGPQERLEKENVENIVKVDFEGMQLATFSCWNEYLTNLYGDYMKLPPEKDRKTHIISMKRVEE